MAKEPTSEKDVKAQVKALLTKHGYFFWMPPANGFGRTGIADINAIKAGVFLAIETKFGKNTVSPMQRAFLNSIRAESGFAFVVSEQRLLALKLWLEAFDRASEATGVGGMPTDEDGALMLDCIRVMTSEL